MPSCELPAMRMIASEIFEVLGDPPAVGRVRLGSLIEDIAFSLFR
jgi:hypothetical protein